MEPRHPECRISRAPVTSEATKHVLAALARGQANPLEKHERAMRALLLSLGVIQQLDESLFPLELAPELQETPANIPT